MKDVRIKIADKTKGQLFKEKTYHAARAAISRNARATFSSSGRPKQCYICDYCNHVEICHVLAVACFSDSAFIWEINSIGNLVALCPTHHWEFDNGYLELEYPLYYEEP